MNPQHGREPTPERVASDIAENATTSAEDSLLGSQRIISATLPRSHRDRRVGTVVHTAWEPVGRGPAAGTVPADWRVSWSVAAGAGVDSGCRGSWGGWGDGTGPSLDLAEALVKLTLTTFLTLDGVMQAPGGPQEDPSGGFRDGGWLVPFADERTGRIVTEQFASADAFLLGRGTYQIFAGFWPQVTDPDDVVAAALNRCPKYVVSSTLRTSDWAGTTIIGADVVTRIRQLQQQPGRELQVHGSHGLAQTLIRHRLIDEYRLWLFPVVLGDGKRLFDEGTVPTTLERVDTQFTTTGVAVHTYRPTGLPRHGAFAVSAEGSTTSDVTTN